MSAEDEARRTYENMGAAGRQKVLDKLGELFGHPYRPYTHDEWLAAFLETI